MNWTDSLPESVRRDIREAGRGHLLGDRPSLAERADDARTAQKEAQAMNTDKAEILGQPVAASTNPGVTSGVRDGDSQGVDAKLADPSMTEAMTGNVQNDGDDDIEAEGGDESADGDEEGPADPFEE